MSKNVWKTTEYEEFVRAVRSGELECPSHIKFNITVDNAIEFLRAQPLTPGLIKMTFAAVSVLCLTVRARDGTADTLLKDVDTITSHPNVVAAEGLFYPETLYKYTNT
jgi:hypothetical protein